MRERYRGYTIKYDPPPIPNRSFDYQYAHDDYDGAPDSGDNRCGTGTSVDDCKMQIDAIEDEDAGFAEFGSNCP